MEFKDKIVSLKTGEKLVIKQASVKDAMTIYRIQNSGCGKKPWSYLNYVIDLMRPSRCYFLAYLNDKSVSMLGSRYVKKTNSWHGRNFATLSEYQGKGIGRVLFDEQLDYFAENGAREYWFETKVTNPAKHLYERMGFEQIDTLKNYYKDGTDAREYWMDLKLRNLVNGNVSTSVHIDDSCFTENGDFEQELDTFLAKAQKNGKRVVTFDSVSGDGLIYEAWTGAIIYRKPFVAVCEKYPKLREMLSEEQLEWLTSDGNVGIQIKTDQLRKIKQAMKLAKSGV